MVYMKKTFVGAGEYYVSHSEPVILQAILGTCLGVVLYDDAAGVGGLIHLLLPEPVGSDYEGNFVRYAATGMPVFIKALIDAGAKRENLKAVMAGGALVGPLDKFDLGLDIGGRSAEIAKTILVKEQIKIIAAETGGFFTCSLELNLANWETTVKPAYELYDKMAGPEKKPSLKDISRSMHNLQPIPQVALKILRIIDQGEYDIDRIAGEVRKDQVISAKTLQFCNSPLFAKRNQVKSIDHALVYLGQNLLIKMIISAAIQKYFDQSSFGYSLCKGGLFYHAVGTAITAEKLAQLTGLIEPSVAYTAGLLHDIGKVVLDQFLEQTHPLFYRELQDETTTLLEAEKKIFAIDHTEAGYILAKQWSLPESLALVIKHHHYPCAFKQKSALIDLVYLADLLMAKFHSGLELEQLDTRNLIKVLKKLELDPRRFAELVDLIPMELNLFE